MRERSSAREAGVRQLGRRCYNYPQPPCKLQSAEKFCHGKRKQPNLFITPSRGDADGRADTRSPHRERGCSPCERARAPFSSIKPQIPQPPGPPRALRTHHCGRRGETAPGKSSCCACNLNNSPQRRSSSSPFPVNQPTGARQTTRGVPAAAELRERKVVLILPARARQPGWARSKRGAAGSAKVASGSHGSAFGSGGVTGPGRR